VLNAIASLLTPEEASVGGTILADGVDVRSLSARELNLGYVLEWVFAALRSSVSFGLTAVVVGEFVGGTAGLGYRMSIASGVLNTPRVFAILLLLAAIGTLVVEAAKWVEQRLLRWQPRGEV
jgi:NitT/TauT family transport system permease protein